MAMLANYPCCDICLDNYNVYCMECEVHSVSCTCVTLEFYCAECNHDFVWEINKLQEESLLENPKTLMREERIESILEDAEILDVSVQQVFTCPNCYQSAPHECSDPVSGTIFKWEGGAMAEDEVLECVCNPPRIYICPKCDVERRHENSKWTKRSKNWSSASADKYAASGGDPFYEIEEVDEPQCYCPTEEKYFCGACRVTRSSPTAKWSAIEGYEQAMKNRRKKNQLPKATNKTPTPVGNSYGRTGSVSAGADWNDYSWMGLHKCRHYGEPVNLPDGTIIHCSSLWDTRKDEKDHPDRGLYFDWSWKPDWRSELSLWPDFNVPTNLTATASAIQEHFAHAKHGEKVEIGCIGGHGRTGTALACMLVLTGLSHKAAGEWVKKNYCTEAIESQSQWWYIEWFEAYIKGQPLPEKPVHKPAVSTGKTNYCTMAEHYTQWVANPFSKVCTKRKAACNMFKVDIKKFAEGKAEPHVIRNALGIQTVSDFNVIDGFKVPKSKNGSPVHANAKTDCKCDYCRYTAKGHGAFLEPVGVTSIYIQVPNGVIKTPVTPEFTPQPPVIDGQNIGHRIGNYVWTAHPEGFETWAWDGVKTAKSKYIAQNVENNKKLAEENKKAGSVQTLEKSEKEVDKAEPKGYSKSNKRNKKNPNRSNRRGKRRR